MDEYFFAFLQITFLFNVSLLNLYVFGSYKHIVFYFESLQI